jgi:hypothetical protein
LIAALIFKLISIHVGYKHDTLMHVGYKHDTLMHVGYKHDTFFYTPSYYLFLHSIHCVHFGHILYVGIIYG